MKAAEEISEKRTVKFEKVKKGNLREKEKYMVREKEISKKLREREKVRNETKEWYSQQGQLISEINKMRKEDQEQNFSINQANLNEFKMKILFKHLKKEHSLKKLNANKTKLEKIRNDVQVTLSLKKEKDSKDLFESITDLYKNPKTKLKTESSDTLLKRNLYY